MVQLSLFFGFYFTDSFCNEALFGIIHPTNTEWTDGHRTHQALTFGKASEHIELALHSELEIVALDIMNEQMYSRVINYACKQISGILLAILDIFDGDQASSGERPLASIEKLFSTQTQVLFVSDGCNNHVAMKFCEIGCHQFCHRGCDAVTYSGSLGRSTIDDIAAERIAVVACVCDGVGAGVAVEQ